MSASNHLLKPSLLGVVGALSFAAVGCNGGALESPRSLPPSTIILALADDLDRAAVEFDHAKHTKALEKDGCATCHQSDEQGRLVAMLGRQRDPADPDALMELYHDRCIGCHEERAAQVHKSLPAACGDCHVEREAATSQRLAMRFDYSLHYRHVKAEGEKCETCHHVYDEATKKLEYKKGAEDACRDCHGARDEGNVLSLANASHRSCISCHQKHEQDGTKGGPHLCIGCHDEATREKMERVAEPPRLLRGQPNKTWIHTAGAKSKVVPFNHERHEPGVFSCSACHHQTLKACKECHTLTGTEASNGVTLATSYHYGSSSHSCVGCHETKTATQDCSGCHRRLQHPPQQRACIICHSGPTPQALGGEPGSGGDSDAAGSIQTPFPEDALLATLPELSDDFPDKVVIDILADEYRGAELPHAKIVAKLDAAVRNSRLASRFHGQTEVLCAGCHHQSPIGTRPPPCRACHGQKADATEDKPALKAAYHRQCVGCHQEMKIKDGCTDCHAEAAGKAAKEVRE